ncbi:MAG: hypothetical protein GJ679_03340 [Rhodobacteraceae bacterium]|nr:hypothetical protein [Paracoccaceae bacterium]
MLVNKIHIFALAAAICTTATASSANSSLFGDDLKNDEAVVLQLQTQLNELGFDAGPTDGAWGRRTAGAVDAFTERFTPAAPFSEANEVIDRLQLIHDSWFAFPFEQMQPIVTPPQPLRSQRVYSQDIRDTGLQCNGCLVITQPLGVGDFDGDGRDEVLVGRHILEDGQPSEQSSELTVLTFDASGAASELSIRTENGAISRIHEREAAVADFNGDGIDDFFIAAHGLDMQPFPGEQNILVLSSADGPVEVSSTNLPIMSDMSHGADAGDIDGDGDVDIVIATHRGVERYEPYVLLNDGTGVFTYQPLSERLDDASILSLYAGRRSNQFSSFRLLDLNGDAKPELVLLRSDQQPDSENTASHILWNEGDGTFSAGSRTDLPTTRWGYQTYTNDAEAIDLDENGFADLILTQSTRDGGWRGHFVQILMQETAGNFVDRTAERFWRQGYQRPMRDMLFADETELVDLDDDGDLDIITRSLAPALQSNGLVDAIAQVGINNGEGVFIPLDPRWVSSNSSYTVRGPTPGRFGPNGELGVLSYIMDGSYNSEPHSTWGATFVRHSLR